MSQEFEEVVLHLFEGVRAGVLQRLPPFYLEANGELGIAVCVPEATAPLGLGLEHKRSFLESVSHPAAARVRYPSRTVLVFEAMIVHHFS